MSRAILEQQLEREKEMNVLRECVVQVDAAVVKLTEETGTYLYAKIEPVGVPTINLSLKNIPAKPASWMFWKSGKKTAAKIQSGLTGVFERWQMICKENGVIPMAKITEFGARIEYALTPEKKESIIRIIAPPQNNLITVSK